MKVKIKCKSAFRTARTYGVVQRYTVDFHDILSDFNFLPQASNLLQLVIIEQIEIKKMLQE
jgi:hypothetical protein